MSASAASIVLGAAGLGVGVPWLFMRMLEPSLESSPGAAATNYRGRSVYYGLGIVWVVWAGCAIVGGVVAPTLAPFSPLPVLMLLGPLALVAFAMGLIDDAYGSSAARGFRGHLRAMLRGRLTTGGLKLVGIGLASLVVALVLSGVSPWGGPQELGGTWDPDALARRAGLALVAGAAIALTSNLINLTDLRPGRALKAYLVLAAFGVLSVGAFVFSRPGMESPSAASLAVDLGALALFVVGPVVAVWRSDLGERGMLGDAGANPMGAVAGTLIVIGLPLWGVVGYLIVVLALNLASERVSFSQVIEGNALLRWLDAIGRTPGGELASGPASESADHDVGSRV